MNRTPSFFDFSKINPESKTYNRLPPAFSTFLDLIRVLAAVEVLLAHIGQQNFDTANAFSWFGYAGHSAVVVFFILSGYLISWTALRDKNLLDYAINRGARIYSVILPAILLCLACFLVMRRYFPSDTDPAYQIRSLWDYLLLFSSFMSESWSLDETLFANGAFWSICFEVWYYVVFGLWFFVSGPRKWVLIIAALIITGPKIWVLFPLWLLGSFIRWLHAKVRIGRPLALVLFVLGLAGTLIAKRDAYTLFESVWLDPIWGAQIQKSLGEARSFGRDYVFAIPIGLIIFAARDARLSFLMLFRRAIGALASVSFSLYMVHSSLLMVLAAFFPGNLALAVLSTLAISAIFGMIFELNKNVLKRALTSAAVLLRPKFKL